MTKPRNLKLIAGTLRPCRDRGEGVPLPLVTTIPAPPSWLPNVRAIEEWKRLSPILIANGLLNEGNLSMFGHLCALSGTLANLWAEGKTPTGHLIAQHTAMASGFGLTPLSQGKIRPIVSASKPNRFLNFGKRR